LRSRAGLLALLGAALVAVAAAAAAPPRYVRGLDVSRWDGRIDWARVRGAGYRFAFAEATNGNTRVDPTYGRNRAGAAAAGVQFGAFHFARPSGRTAAAVAADAVAEADRFLAVAQPRSGELLPVLDLEQSSGLRPPALIAWTSAWLAEVQRKLGLRAIIYSSPHFWATAMADTPRFALAGSPLWLAHWTRASAPRVPGRNWGASGWRFWQWTSCGHVPGTGHCIDQDRFSGTSFTPVAVSATPFNTALPVVTGIVARGELLQATSGRWNGRLPMTYAYQWLRCDPEGADCTPIDGATTVDYTVSDADAGSTLVVSVTATNRRGSASAVSSPTEVVQ
jgi:lysozyme